MSAKKYGLIIKKTNKDNQVQKTSVFGNESSGEEDDQPKRGINTSLMREAEKKKQMKQTQIEIDKALKEDPTVYQYDDIYDDMVKKKKAVIPKLSEKDRKPKYIESLLKSAKSRKMEEERRAERKTHKEREEEGGEFQDKEEFVTSAYRKRMLELEEEEKQLRQQDAIDARNDVTKRSDLSMFYSNLLKQNVSMGGTFCAESSSTDEKSDKRKSEHIDDKSTTGKHEKSKEKQIQDTKTKEDTRHSSKDDRRLRHTVSDDRGNRRKDDSDKYSRARDGHYQQQRDYYKEKDRSKSRREIDSHSESSRDVRRKHDKPNIEERLESERSRERKADNESNPEDKKTEQTEQDKIALSKFAKRSDEETISSAKQRYLERKRAREIALQQRKKDDSDED